MDHSNTIAELRLWAKDDTLPGLQELCKVAADGLEAYRWIPVGERLPEKNGKYLTLGEFSCKTPESIPYRNNVWLSLDKVTHWQEIILPGD